MARVKRWLFQAIWAVAIVGVGAVAVSLGLSTPVRALPSYARQTGQGCPACHTNFPELTPFGRVFKLNGYTLSTGESDIPPFAVMVIPGFTNINRDQPGNVPPHFGPNNNFSLEAASLFYGGKIVDDVGAFAQATYSDTAKNFNWDNTDIRFAKNATIFDHDLIFGVDFNNNPTVQDIYNSTPAFGYPYASPSLAPKPITATLIEGGLAQQVGALGAYAMIDNTIYTEFSLYKTLPQDMQRTFGIHPDNEAQINGVAPYWRVALQRDWSDNSASIGTFVLAANTFPGRDRSQGTDHFTDIGIDAQYNLVSGSNIVALEGYYIHENQDLNATFGLGNSANPSNTLNSAKLKGSYYYSHGDAKYGATVQYFSIWGSADTGLFAPGPITGSNNGRPDTHGWIFELNYLPFINSNITSLWPWAQVKFSLQYTLYNKFNGAGSNYDGFGRNASDNNTLFLYAWLAF